MRSRNLTRLGYSNFASGFGQKQTSNRRPIYVYEWFGGL